MAKAVERARFNVAGRYDITGLSIHVIPGTVLDLEPILHGQHACFQSVISGGIALPAGIDLAGERPFRYRPLFSRPVG